MKIIVLVVMLRGFIAAKSNPFNFHYVYYLQQRR
jgi:hypothetical protein